MTKTKISIVGLDVLGQSLGMALRQSNGDFIVVGHDPDPEATRAAKRSGAVDRTEWNLHNACDEASLLITTSPLQDLEELLRQVQEDLAPGAVIVAVGEVLSSAQEIARRVLSGPHFVAIHPVLTQAGGELSPSAQLFHGAQICIASSLETAPEALELVNNLVHNLEAKPLYIDPTEHDGIVSLLEQLPKLVGAALMQVSSQAPGWKDGQKLAGRTFAHSTDIGDDPAALATALHANRLHLSRSLDALEEALVHWRSLLEQADEAALRDGLSQAIDQRRQWARNVELKEWEPPLTPPPEEQPGLFRQMFFGDLFRPRRREPEKE